MSSPSKDILLEKIRGGSPMTGGERLRLSWLLGFPAILAQLSNILMQYIDASMVGHLGASQAAAIGLVSSSTWIMGGFCMATSSGFSVQVAQLIGAGDFARARKVMRQGLVSVVLFALCLAGIGASISPYLPLWLGGGHELLKDASAYYLIFCVFLPFMQLSWTGAAILQATGNMKVPSMMYIGTCALDVIFNYLFIYVAGMGVKGAALGTALAEAVTAVAILSYLFTRSPELRLGQDRHASWAPDRRTISNALGISGPMWLQNIIMRGAYIVATIIVAPLGTVAIAANSFAIIAESLCYMPGYGLEEAVTALVGQSIGARRKELAKSFAWINIGLAAALMSVFAVLMYIFAPQMMGIFTTDTEVIALGVKCLRIEAFAEFFYAVSIVGYGACVGAGDTLVPTIMNFASIWLVRIVLALILTPKLGLVGYWIAMCIELNVRGIIFAIRVKGNSWMKKVFVTEV